MQNADPQPVSLADYQKLQSENEELKQRLAWFERMLFDRKSERYVPDEEVPGQLKLGFESRQAQEVEASVKQLIAEHERQKAVPTKESAHKGRQPIPAHFPRVEEVIQPEGEDLAELTRIGEDITEVLEMNPGRVWVRRIVRPRYVRKESQPHAKTGSEQEVEQSPIVQAPAKELPFGRSKAGVSLIVHILMAKYVEHLPLHRLIQRFGRLQLKVPPATIGHWVKVGAQPLLILYEAYQKIVFESFYLQMDETTLKVLEDGKGKTHLGYLWAVFDPVHSLPFFFYQKGRDHRGPKSFLDRFAGILQCDGFSVYETLNKRMDHIALMNCMAHIRRKFFDAKSNDPERAHTALTMIKALYLIETKARDQQLAPEQRLALRLAESKPIFDTLGHWLEIEYDKVTPSSAIGKAIQYALNRWKNMIAFLAEGHVEIDNNLVENIIRPAAIGRKNYLFAGSHESAQRTAMLYTFFTACKHHGIDPEQWLTDVLNRINDYKISQLYELMPQHWRPDAQPSTDSAGTSGKDTSTVG